MRKYLAIGHFKESENMVSVAMVATSVKSFKENCAGNAFVPYVVITEQKLEVLKNTDCLDLFEEVKKLTTNYRKWNDITDYIEQCMDIMDERMAMAE